MSNRQLFSAMIGSLLLCVSSASAQNPTSLSPPYLSYAAKYVCSETGDNLGVAEGFYRSTINIHNPQSRLPVKFLKKVVLAHPEGQSGCVTVINPKEVLEPDAAEQVDCIVIHQAVFQTPQQCFPPGTTTTVLEGFVVIQIPPADTGAVVLTPVLDVVGNYTARPAQPTMGVSTWNVVVYSPLDIRQ